MSDTAQLAITGITAAASILDEIVGASLQCFYSRSAKEKRHEHELHSNIYSDYLWSVGEAKTLQTVMDSHGNLKSSTKQPPRKPVIAQIALRRLSMHSNGSKTRRVKVSS